MTVENKEEMQEKVTELADKLTELEIAKFRLESKETKLIAEIVDLFKSAEKYPEHPGQCKSLDDGNVQLKLTRRQNVRYQKERGEDHPLKKLIENYPHLKKVVRISYSEAGKKFMEAITSEEYGTANAILQNRLVSEGKPKIELKEM